MGFGDRWLGRRLSSYPPAPQPFARRPLTKKLPETTWENWNSLQYDERESSFELLLCHSAPTEAILGGSFYSLRSLWCLGSLPLLSLCSRLVRVLCVCSQIEIFIFQRALNLSTKIKLKKWNKKDKPRTEFEDCWWWWWLLLLLFFAGNILYYTDFILIIINLCLYWRCV